MFSRYGRMYSYAFGDQVSPLNTCTLMADGIFTVDIRSPPGHPMNTTSLNQIRFLRALREEESQETLIKCTLLIFVRNSWFSLVLFSRKES